MIFIINHLKVCGNGRLSTTKIFRKIFERKTQNFLVDDDEFEFEFLNMDDKDL